MALQTILVSGFEMNNATDGKLWNSADGAVINSAVQKKTGAYSGIFYPIVAGGQLGYWEKIDTTGAVAFRARIWLYVDTQHGESAAQKIFGAYAAAAGGTPIVSLRITNDAKLQLWNDASSTQIGSTSSQQSTGTWIRAEMRWFSNGTTSANINGTEFATGTGPTSSTVQWYRVGFSTALTVNDVAYYIDDVRIDSDTAASSSPAMIGDGRIVKLVPNAAGSNAMGSRIGTDSGSDYGQVDDDPPDDGTGATPTCAYNLDATNDILDVNIEAASGANKVPSGSTINLVAVNAIWAGQSSSACAGKIRITHGGSTAADAAGRGVSLDSETGWATNGTYSTVYRNPLIAAVCPSTGTAWTIAQIDAAEIGLQATDAAPDVYLDALWALVEYLPSAGYTLTCTPGSYSLTGTDATLQAQRKVIATAGEYAMTGTSATLALRKTLTATPGSYALSGTDAVLKANRRLITAQDAFILTGTNATLKAVRKVVATPGAYTMSGTDSTLKAMRKVVATPGAFALTGTDTTLKALRMVVATPGAFNLTGTDAVLKALRKMVASAGAFTVTGTSADLYIVTGPTIYTLTCTPGAFSLTGTNATLKAQRKVIATPGVYNITGTEPVLRSTRRLIATPGVYAITGTSAIIGRRFILVTETGSYVIAGTQSELRALRKLIAQSGAYVVTGSAADLNLIAGAGEGRRWQPPFSAPFFPPGQARRQ
jgi:hypothetical protein